MKLGLPPKLVKQALAGHSWLGITVGALMYVVCLTGTLSVFYPNFERWEQPQIHESLDYNPEVLELAFNGFMANDEIRTPHMYVNMPTTFIPRTVVTTEEQGWFVNADGSIGDAEEHGWTEFLIDMHLYLTIPGALGLILVSSLGAMLCGLIVSGFLSHPSIFKDAFKLRLDGKSRLEQVDIHNRLSVWGAPFHLLIAITGAYFGLVIPLLGVASYITGQDQDEIVAAVFGTEPEIHQQGEFQISTALRNLQDIAPDATPFRMIVHDSGTPGQFLEILASHPNRMIYSENYRFDRNGEFLGKSGFSDGEVGKQVVYSMYYLHFGHFGGLGVQLIYFALGFALTVVSVTGINIWLKKRAFSDAWNDIWVGIVWGLPIVLLFSAVTRFLFGFVSVPLVWLNLMLLVAYCLHMKAEVKSKAHLQLTSMTLIAVLLLIHIAKFGAASFSPAGALINGGLLLSMLVLGLLVYFQRRQEPAIRSLAAESVSA